VLIILITASRSSLFLSPSLFVFEYFSPLFSHSTFHYDHNTILFSYDRYPNELEKAVPDSDEYDRMVWIRLKYNFVFAIPMATRKEAPAKPPRQSKKKSNFLAGSKKQVSISYLILSPHIHYHSNLQYSTDLARRLCPLYLSSFCPKRSIKTTI
jgi:hypothetical protein